MTIERLLTLDAQYEAPIIDTEEDSTDELVTYAEPVDVDPGVWAVPLQSGEDTGPENVVSETLKVFLPGAGSFEARGRLTVLGHRYEFDGDPFVWTNPRTGIVSHQTGALRRVD